jgi:hypothetical protein
MGNVSIENSSLRGSSLRAVCDKIMKGPGVKIAPFGSELGFEASYANDERPSDAWRGILPRDQAGGSTACHGRPGTREGARFGLRSTQVRALRP